MQRRKDELDKLIINSFEDINISHNYNEKLIEKLNKSKFKNQISVSGICFITSGILLMVLNITNYYYKFFELQYLLKAELNLLFQNINKLLGA